MVTLELYRAKAAEYVFANSAANGPGEAREFQRRQRSLPRSRTTSSGAGHRDQSVPATGAANEAAPVSIGDAAAAVQQ